MNSLLVYKGIPFLGHREGMGWDFRQLLSTEGEKMWILNG